jgi:hypothetical protein
MQPRPALDIIERALELPLQDVLFLPLQTQFFNQTLQQDSI